MMKNETQTEVVQTNTVTLQPLAMVTPTRKGIYAPSRIGKKRIITQVEFLIEFADNPRPLKVSFEPDGKSNPQIVTAYGNGLDCWYIVES